MSRVLIHNFTAILTFRTDAWYHCWDFVETGKIWALLSMRVQCGDESRRCRMARKVDTKELVSRQHPQIVDEAMVSHFWHVTR